MANKVEGRAVSDPFEASERIRYIYFYAGWKKGLVK